MRPYGSKALFFAPKAPEYEVVVLMDVQGLGSVGSVTRGEP